MTDTTPEHKKFTGKHMIIAMLSFFAVILCANLVMVYFAKTSWTGLVTQHSYKENQVFDKKTERLQKMQQLGINLKAQYQDGKIIIVARDQADKAISDATLDIIVGRVIHERDDQVLRMSETALGRYEVEQPLAQGRWQIRVSMALSDGQTWEKTYYIQVRAE